MIHQTENFNLENNSKPESSQYHLKKKWKKKLCLLRDRLENMRIKIRETVLDKSFGIIKIRPRWK